MGQEFFGGPEYFQEFDPEKFARELKAQAEREARKSDTGVDSPAGQEAQDTDGEPPQH
ncbi:hypothetical protein [Corynebacterium guangdongense]|uniref:Uncharacterized protein n=1 Tax=Corynebacterium guangdongense TaxID=1783348 RepID=A0ABU1ZXZ6_9CORY|nr:hypothetical protein [Corynebacterium guangdongense]MDR7329805.1 hypothetical protein [Corynebacterium guangdongense]WJZ18368.1 hypothetical protein CGUA_09035 [Corynebacterium guangdongense]